MDILETAFWVEKYKPRKIEDCILTESNKIRFEKFVERGHFNNLILSGSAGVGKTTIARVLSDELGMDYKIYNGSNEARHIEFVRGELSDFATTVSIGGGGKKVAIIDEADYMNPQSVQPSLRNFIETNSDNCIFIFTCNHPNNIIEPIKSRCTHIDFTIADKDERVDFKKKIFERLSFILKTENREFDKKAIAGLVNKFFPDCRKMINFLSSLPHDEVITDEMIERNLWASDNVEGLAELMKKLDFNACRQWINEKQVYNSQAMRKIYDIFIDVVPGVSKAELVLIYSNRDKAHQIVVDQEINFLAYIVEVMGLIPNG